MTEAKETCDGGKRNLTEAKETFCPTCSCALATEVRDLPILQRRPAREAKDRTCDGGK